MATYDDMIAGQRTEAGAGSDANPGADAPGTVAGGDKPQAEPVATVGYRTGKGENADEDKEAAAAAAVTVERRVPDEFRGSTNKDLIEYLERKVAGGGHTREDEERMRRRQHRERIMAGVSDAVRAIANMWAANNYAPNMYDANSSMSAKTRERLEKEKAEFDAEDERYYNYLQNLARLKGQDQDKAFNIWNLDRNMQLQERAYSDAREEKERQLEYSRERDRAADELARLKIEENARQFDASVAAGRYDKSRGGRGGSGGGSGKYRFNGEAYQTKAEYDAAVRRAAKDYGVEDYYLAENMDAYGNKSRTQKQKSISQLAAETELKIAERENAAKEEKAKWGNTSKLKWN